MSLLNTSSLSRAAGESADSIEKRTAALASLAEKAMPTGREEEWRYVDLGFDIAEFDLAQAVEDWSGETTGGIVAEAGSASVVDGSVVAARSSAEGLSVSRSTEAGGSLISGEKDIFTAAHLAFGAEYVHIVVGRRKAIPDPVVVHVRAAADAASFPAVRIDVADGGEATVALQLGSADDVAALVVPHVEARLGADANLSLVVSQQWGRETNAIGQLAFDVGPDSTLRLAEAGLGGAYARWQADIKLAGRGSNARVIGAYFGDEEQTFDYRYLMHHAAPNTHSEMFLKGAVEGEAASVFTGLIRIDEEAQRTDAFQTNRNLILSDGASAQSVPNLEILANDVKCGHASTVGQLDAEQRYYLMSRGLDRSRADRLQVRGFFEDALSRFPIARLVGPLRDRFNSKFIDAQKAGRV